MTKEKLVELVEKLLTADYKTEKEGDELLELLESNVLNPNISDLIFWDDRELTAEEILEEALAYKPIQLSISSE